MAWQDNKEYVIRGGWDEANQCYTGCETNDNGVISMCRVRELDEVFGATDAQITEAYERCRWEDIRAHRDFLIAQSDYLALQDTPDMSDEWTTYRQALRDITKQSDVDNITWPEKPE